MKKSRAVISLTLVTSMLLSNLPFVYANNEISSEIIIKEFAQDVDDEEWNQLTDLYSSVEKDEVSKFFNSSENDAENIGYFSIDDFDLVRYDKIDEDDLPKFADIEKYKESIYGNKEFVRYRIMVDIECKEESQFFYNGLNYFLVALVNEDNDWKIAEFSAALPSLTDYVSKSKVQKN